jgi:putative nucleotidyltransferase with HDIG domain
MERRSWVGLRTDYQPRIPPAMTADDTILATDLRTDTSSRGTDGNATLYPFRVTFQGAFGRLRRSSVCRSGVEAALAVWAASLCIGATAMAIGLIATGSEVGPLAPIAALSALGFLGERQSVRLDRSLEISISSLPILFAAVAFGPLAAMLVGAVSLLSQFRAPYLRWTVWTASRALVGGGAGLAAAAVAPARPWNLGTIVIAVACASVAESACDLAANSVTVSIRGTGSIRTVARSAAPILVAAVPLYTSVVSLLAYAYHAVSPISVIFFLIPAFIAQRLFVLYREQRETAEELTAVNRRLENANLSFASALVATLDARDRYTAGHSATVAVYARDIAHRMGLSDDEQRLAHLCGLVHDIGKIGLPAGLLEKMGPLTLEERRQMEQHAEIGERILAKVDDYAMIARIVRHHHERVDGNGYPDRLRGDEIPMIARILSVADAYDAMTSDRPYREAMPSRVARLRLAQAVESQFDTSVVAAFEAILASAAEEYRVGRREEFSAKAQFAVYRLAAATTHA